MQIDEKTLDKILTLQRQLTMAMQALKELYDAQNGPPLETQPDKYSWEKAMQDAHFIINEYDRATKFGLR